ncbi:TlpA family protein disulfide reductase [bacterium]|nr:TlpA family protein disulfide reductase [bacterium]
MNLNRNKAWRKILGANLIMVLFLFSVSCQKDLASVDPNNTPLPSQVTQPEKPEQISPPSSAILDQYLIPKDQRVAAKDFELPTLDGKKFQLKSLEGKIVLIDFSTTWCTWCTTQEPHLDKLYEEYHNQSFEIISIFCKENKETVLYKYPTGKHTYPILLDDSGFVSSNQYGVQGYPYYLLLDKQGNIAYYQRGYEEKMYNIVSQLIEHLNTEIE